MKYFNKINVVETSSTQLRSTDPIPTDVEIYFTYPTSCI